LALPCISAFTSRVSELSSPASTCKGLEEEDGFKVMNQKVPQQANKHRRRMRA
jgi:hypothetical protein